MAEISWTKGIQLRAARHLLPDGSVLQALNLVPDELGALVTRKGMTLEGSIPGHDLNSFYILHGYGSIPDHSYQGHTSPLGAFAIHRDYTTQITGPGPLGGYCDFADMREFQGEHQWVFVAGGQTALRIKDDGINTYKWGIAAPSLAPTATASGAGQPNGTYTYRYIFVRHGVLPASNFPTTWGNPSPESAPITVTNQQITVSGIINPQLAGPNQDLQITHAYIFRNKAANPDIWFFVGSILPSVTTTFVDNLNDVSAPETSGLPSGILEFDNGLPPVFSSIAVHQERIWGATGTDNRVWYSKQGLPEQFSASGYLELGPLSDTAMVVKAFDGRLYVGTDSRFMPILGSDEASYRPDDTPVPVGLTSPFSLAQGLKGLYWRGPDGVYRWNGSSAQNITEGDLYPIFHGQAAHGFLPAAYTTHPYGPQYFSVGGWFEGRYYLTYETTGPPGSYQTLVYDEMTETWYADSRVFRRYYYSRQQQKLIGTTNVGDAYRLQQGTTDAGTPISWTFQSRDEHDGDPQSDNSLTEVTLDLDTGGAVATLSVDRDYGQSLTPVATVASAGRQQQIVPLPIESLVAKAFGYRLEGIGSLRLYRLWSQLLVFPQTRLAFDTLRMDLGYPGPKRLTGLIVDATLLDPGTLTPTLIADGLPRAVRSQSTMGRTQQNLLVEPFEATIIQVSLRATGRFRLYPSTHLSWTPLPITHRFDEMIPSDLGYAGEKQITGLWADTELLAPGVLIGNLLADGSAVPLLPQVTVGRRAANVLTTPITATLVGAQWTATADFRRWPPTSIRWVPLPQSTYQDTISGSDLGHVGEKRLVGVFLDTEMLAPGMITPTLLVDGVEVPLLAQQVAGRQLLNVLTQDVDGSIFGLRVSSTAPFRRWSGSYLAWLPLPAAYFDYHWPLSSFGTANEKVLQAVNLDIEPMTAAGATFVVVVNGQLTFTFPLPAGGRRVTGRLRFPRTAHGNAIEYRLISAGRWRLWGGELLFQVLGSAGLQRMVITTPGGAVGPDVQKSSLDQTVLGPQPQATALESSGSGSSTVQRTPLVHAA